MSFHVSEACCHSTSLASSADFCKGKPVLTHANLGCLLLTGITLRTVSYPGSVTSRTSLRCRADQPQGWEMGCPRVSAWGNSWRRLCHQTSVLGRFCTSPACSHVGWHLGRGGRRNECGKMNEANTAPSPVPDALAGARGPPQPLVSDKAGTTLFSGCRASHRG